MSRNYVIAALFVVARCVPLTAEEPSKPLRAGMIGLDTSHVIAFTKAFNDPKATGDLADIRIVAGYPGGTDIPASKNRVAKFTAELREQGVQIVDSIPALLELVDVVLLESVDGRPHLEQARPVLEAGKPLYIDKPLAGSLADAVAIFDLAKKYGTPCFSSSSLRFTPALSQLGETGVGEVTGCSVWAPCSLEPTVPDLFYYGVHGVEALFTIMGPGCVEVTRTQTKDTELVVGVWEDGRVGTFRGIRNAKSEYAAVVFGTKGISRVTTYAGYEPMLRAMARFFKTKEVPVPPEATLEIFAFMEAADESKRRGGERVSVAETLKKATAAARKS